MMNKMNSRSRCENNYKLYYLFKNEKNAFVLLLLNMFNNK